MVNYVYYRGGSRNLSDQLPQTKTYTLHWVCGVWLCARQLVATAYTLV